MTISFPVEKDAKEEDLIVRVSITAVKAAHIRPVWTAIKWSLVGFVVGSSSAHRTFSTLPHGPAGFVMAVLISGLTLGVIVFVVTFVWLLLKKRRLSRSQ